VYRRLGRSPWRLRGRFRPYWLGGSPHLPWARGSSLGCAEGASIHRPPPDYAPKSGLRVWLPATRPCSVLPPWAAKPRVVRRGRQAPPFPQIASRRSVHSPPPGGHRFVVHLHLGLSAHWCQPVMGLRPRTRLSAAPLWPTRTTLSPWCNYRCSLRSCRRGATPTECTKTSPVRSQTCFKP